MVLTFFTLRLQKAALWVTLQSKNCFLYISIILCMNYSTCRSLNISQAAQFPCCDKLIICAETHACGFPVLSIVWICAKYNMEFPLFFALILYNSDSNYSLNSGVFKKNSRDPGKSNSFNGNSCYLLICNH